MSSLDAPANSDFNKAYAYATHLLSVRLRTTGELREKLHLKGFAPPIIDQLLQNFIDQHYLDDQRFAEIYLDNLKKYKHFGFYGIKKKLIEKRQALELIDQILTEQLTPAEERAIAERYLKKEFGSLSELDRALKNKLAQRLRARGFRVEVISRVTFGASLAGTS